MVRHKKNTELYVKCLNVNDIKDDRLFWKQSVSFSLERTVSESSKIALIENNEKSPKVLTFLSYQHDNIKILGWARENKSHAKSNKQVLKILSTQVF